MQVVLVMFRTGGERRSFSMTRDMTVIGRREDCDFRIPLGEISRKHCRLIKDDGVLRAEDLGSSNGTYINGVRVQEGVLEPGDTLKVGSVVFVVQIDGVPTDESLNPTGESPSDSAINPAEGASTEEHLNPTAQSDAGDFDAELQAPAANEAGALVADASRSGHAQSAGAAATVDDDFVITDDTPADSSAAEYDPMSVLTQDPEDSSVGEPTDADIADDILMDLEAQDQQKLP